MSSSSSIPSVPDVAIYEGRDPAVSMVQLCGSCKKESSPSLPLQRCSRCQIVFYCCRDCQKSDFANHKSLCKKIQKLTTAMKEEGDALQEIDGYEEVFTDDSVGRFWGLFETRDYMRARLRLANELYDFACQANPPQLHYWNCMLEHYQEMLRLCMSDNLGLRSRFPFLLLEMNRDDDAANFVIYWLNQQRSDDEDSHDETVSRHENSSEGEWIYPKVIDARFINILEPFMYENTKYIDLSMLVAAACIKMRLVAIEMSQEQTMKAFNSSKLGVQASPVNHIVESMLPASDKRLKGQRYQLDKLLDIIHQNNPAVLPALLNPDPLLNQPRPGSYGLGDASEAYFVVENAVRIWNRIPGASQILEKRCGPTSKYSAVLR